MRKGFLIAFVFLFYWNAYSQDTTEIKKERYKKNELSISFSSLNGGLSIYNTSEDRFYLAYNRIFEKIKLRTSIANSNYNSQNDYLNKIKVSDSVIILSKNNYISSESKFKIGFQNISKSPIFQFYYGADLLIGFLDRFIDTQITDYILIDGEYVINPYVNYGRGGIDAANKKEYAKFGISPIIGFNYVLNKHFLIGAFLSNDNCLILSINDERNARWFDSKVDFEILFTYRF